MTNTGNEVGLKKKKRETNPLAMIKGTINSANRLSFNAEVKVLRFAGVCILSELSSGRTSLDCPRDLEEVQDIVRTSSIPLCDENTLLVELALSTWC